MNSYDNTSEMFDVDEIIAEEEMVEISIDFKKKIDYSNAFVAPGFLKMVDVVLKTGSAAVDEIDTLSINNGDYESVMVNCCPVCWTELSEEIEETTFSTETTRYCPHCGWESDTYHE